MGETTAIEWTDATWNPWMGCTKVSPACQNCYAERDMKRYGRDFSKITRTSNKTFESPLHWKDPKKVFVCSWSDFFHSDVPKGWRLEAMGIINRCPQHTFILLTKRPENIIPFLRDNEQWGGKVPGNVWIGTTVENQEIADKRIPELLRVSAKVHFVSMEPLCGPVDISKYLKPEFYVGKTEEEKADLKARNCAGMHRLQHIDWVIVGGESGPNARPMNISWVRSLRDQCDKAGVPYFFKQWGEWKGVTRDADMRVKMKDDPRCHLWPDEGWESPVSLKVGRKLSGSELDGKHFKQFPGGANEQWNQ